MYEDYVCIYVSRIEVAIRLASGFNPLPLTFHEVPFVYCTLFVSFWKYRVIFFHWLESFISVICLPAIYDYSRIFSIPNDIREIEG